MTPKLVGAPEDRKGPGDPREASGEGRARVESGRVSVQEERWGRPQERKTLGRGLGQGAGTPGGISGPATHVPPARIHQCSLGTAACAGLCLGPCAFFCG